MIQQISVPGTHSIRRSFRTPPFNNLIMVQFPKSWHPWLPTPAAPQTLDPTADRYVTAQTSRPGVDAMIHVKNEAIDGRTDRMDWTATLIIVGGSLMYGLLMMVITQLELSPIALAMVSLGVLAAAMLPATLVLVGRLSGPETRGMAMGVLTALGSVGFAAGLLLSGVLAQELGYTDAFIVGA